MNYRGQGSRSDMYGIRGRGRCKRCYQFQTQAVFFLFCSFQKLQIRWPPDTMTWRIPLLVLMLGSLHLRSPGFPFISSIFRLNPCLLRYNASQSHLQQCFKNCCCCLNVLIEFKHPYPLFSLFYLPSHDHLRLIFNIWSRSLERQPRLL